MIITIGRRMISKFCSIGLKTMFKTLDYVGVINNVKQIKLNLKSLLLVKNVYTVAEFDTSSVTNLNRLYIQYILRSVLL